MTMAEQSVRRRYGLERQVREQLENECDSLAAGVDRLSKDLEEAYSLLKRYEPEYVNSKLGIQDPQPAPIVNEGAQETPND